MLLRTNAVAAHRRPQEPSIDDLTDVVSSRLVASDIPVWLHDEGIRLDSPNVDEHSFTVAAYPIGDIRQDDRLVIADREYRVYAIEATSPVAVLKCYRLAEPFAETAPRLAGLYAAIGPTAAGAIAALNGLSHSAVGADGVVVVPAADEPQYIAFATDDEEDAPTDIRETGNPFGARGSFLPAVGADDVLTRIDGRDMSGMFRTYVSVAPWSPAGLGREWSVGPGPGGFVPPGG